MKLESKSTKRSYALAVTLVLLVFSLMGNVLLYTLYLKNGMDRGVENGKQIVRAAEGAKRHVASVMDGTAGLLEAVSPEERASALYRLGLSLRDADLLAEFTETAVKISGEDAAAERRSASDFILSVERSFGDIANGAGVLTAAERKEILAIRAAYEQMQGILDKFDTSAGDNKSFLIRLQNGGGGWAVIGGQLLDAMSGFGAAGEGQ
ncbi:hypothetical protein [Paenibacillus sp. 32O-W]|uniref:hypothetical protein n=1 Tax=Paenibacillus sp. 32O-W TaxID=1695218 RepID=UPI00078467C2|nr:hypothetical protein [Paenibacillus sp. 32O-W]